jgi:hypothetical protein
MEPVSPAFFLAPRAGRRDLPCSQPHDGYTARVSQARELERPISIIGSQVRNESQPPGIWILFSLRERANTSTPFRRLYPTLLLIFAAMSLPIEKIRNVFSVFSIEHPYTVIYNSNMAILTLLIWAAFHWSPHLHSRTRIRCCRHDTSL